jgi:thiosulfate reductase cytochrome b subunit
MDKRKYIEYEKIRQEILDTFNREFNIVSLSFTATVAIIGYGLLIQSPNLTYFFFLFLLTLIILSFALIQLIQGHYSVLTLATYIRAIIEQENNEMNFETIMFQIRKEDSDKKWNYFQAFSVRIIFALIVITGIISLLLGFYFSTQSNLGLELFNKEFFSPLRLSQMIVIIVTVAWFFFLKSCWQKISLSNIVKFEEELEAKFKKWNEERDKLRKANLGK